MCSLVFLRRSWLNGGKLLLEECIEEGCWTVVVERAFLIAFLFGCFRFPVKYAIKHIAGRKLFQKFGEGSGSTAIVGVMESDFRHNDFLPYFVFRALMLAMQSSIALLSSDTFHEEPEPVSISG